MLRMGIGTMRSLGLGALLLVGVPGLAEAPRRHPEGWKVTVRSSPVSKHGMYDVSVVVKDEARRPVNDAQVRLRLHSFGDAGYRFVEARPVGDGEYRTWTRLNSPWDNPQRLKVWVTPAERSAQ